jgi:hypothetical protein
MEEFLPCSKRQKVVHFSRDGSQERTHQCSEPRAPMAGQKVTPAECAACPVRSMVTRLDVATGAHKPPPQDLKILGKARISRAEGYLDCHERLEVTVPSCCGKTMKLYLCDSVDCAKFGTEVSPIICAKCPHRS